MDTLSRDIPVEKERCAVLYVDVQYYNVYPDGGQYVSEKLTAKEAK